MAIIYFDYVLGLVHLRIYIYLTYVISSQQTVMRALNTSLATILNYPDNPKSFSNFLITEVAPSRTPLCELLIIFSASI